MSIRKKLLSVFLLCTLLILIVNCYIQHNINEMVKKVDSVYGSNVSLNELQEKLEHVQESMKNYLDTKRSDAMEEYFEAQTDYEDVISGLNDENCDNSSKMMEKNIRYISETYLNVTDETVEAKRGRNVEKYREEYEETVKLYSYIQTYIYSLNNEQFKNNSRQYNLMASTLRYSEGIDTVILIAMTLFNVVFLILLSRQITAPLSKLAEAAEEVGKGNFDVELPMVQTHDEVGKVTMAFQKMLASVKIYISELRESMVAQSKMRENELIMETHLKDAQLKYLQAQINPHFLFNTLNAGAQLAMMENASRSYAYIQNVADFYRYNLKGMEEVSLEEELNLIDYYMYILNVRFSNEIHYYKKIDEGVIDIRVPSMILQPIVENSVNYGIRDIEREKRIELEVFAMDELICISIRDNGVGISDEKIWQIMHNDVNTEDSDHSNGVGMNNVLSRLRLYYGVEDVMDITRLGENEGTEVTLYLPNKGVKHNVQNNDC